MRGKRENERRRMRENDDESGRGGGIYLIRDT
jgi:hypothetical protein